MLRPAREPRGPLRLSSAAWTWIGLLSALLALGLGGRVGRWVGVGLILAVGPGLIAPLLRLPLVADRRAQLARLVPWLIVGALGVSLLGELLIGHPPASRDHGIHYFHTRVFVEELLPRGELVGWSDSLNTGYPFGDSYPVIGYILTGAANLLSFGAISLRTSYAWGLLAVWLIAISGVAWLAKVIAEELGEGSDGPMIDPAWAGAFAAIAWLIDPGASREGGWNYTMFHGVWPQLLSSGLWIASLPATFRALQRPSVRALALAGLLLGTSILAHPFGMLTAATSTVAWPVVLWATGSLRRLPPGALRFGVIVHVIAGLVAVGGVLTFLASADSMSRSPVPWKPLGELAAEVLAGELFTNHRAWLGPLALIGIIVGLRRGGGLAWLGLTLAVGLLVLGSDASITVLRLDLLVSAFKNLQFPRYSIGLKPVLFAFVGIGAALVLHRIRGLSPRDPSLEPGSLRSPLRPAAARALACLLLAPVIVGAFDDRGRLLPSPVGVVTALEGSVHEDDERALAAALVAESEALGRPPTVAFLRRGMGGGTYPIFAITDVGAKLILDGHIPTVNYKYQVRRRSPEALRVVGVTHVLFDRRLSKSADDRRLGELLEPIGEFGDWTLARFDGGQAGATPFVVHGGVAAEDVIVEHPSPTEWIVRVERGEGQVQLPLGPYRKWQIERDGRTIEAEPIALAKGIPGHALNFEGPGEVRLTYSTPNREGVAGWISLFAILACVVGFRFDRELHLVERIWAERTRRGGVALLGLALVVLVVVALRKQERQLAKTWDAILIAHTDSKQVLLIDAGEAPLAKRSFVRDLVDDEAWQVTRSNPDGCDGLLGKDAKAGCTQEDSRSRLAMAYRAPYLYRCLRVEVPAQGWLQLDLELDDDEDLVGFLVREGRDLQGLEWRLPGQPDYELPRQDHARQHFHASARGRGGESAIELRNGSGRPLPLCFGLAAAK